MEQCLQDYKAEQVQVVAWLEVANVWIIQQKRPNMRDERTERQGRAIQWKMVLL